MAGIIHLLPEGTANQIAAGEVVQRPASVVKELMENAVDAGATTIKLYIKNGGSTLIQVDDNGSGMNAFDARMCWERHATSKITKAADLYNLSTLGFRGEALASIASVSEVEMKTKTTGEQAGTRIVISGGKLLTQEPVATTQGTSISVKNLFYNIPARKNFLKSMSVENRHILDELQRIALAYPLINFEFYNQEKQLLKLNGGNIFQRISDVLGIKEADLIPTIEQTEIVQINGFIGTPKAAKRTRGLQFLFANGRFVKDPYLNHAISSAYSALIEPNSFPSFVLFLQVSPEKIDVNIHPTKHEVKFEDGRHIYTLLHAVVKKTLGTHYTTPIHFNAANAAHFPERQGGTFEKYMGIPSPNNRFNPFEPAKKRTETSFEKMESMLHSISDGEHSPQVSLPLPAPSAVSVNQVFQIYNRYIGFVLDGAFWLLNYHRAHYVVMYDKYKSSIHKARPSQQLLFPRTVELSISDFSLFLDIKSFLNEMGFDISEFGKNTVIINGLPTELAKEDAGNILQDMLDDYNADTESLGLPKREAIIRIAAQNAAAKSGKLLNEASMKTLISDYFNCENRQYTPNGKRVIVQISAQAVEQFFR